MGIHGSEPLVDNLGILVVAGYGKLVVAIQQNIVVCRSAKVRLAVRIFHGVKGDIKHSVP